jgi:NADP-dependent 3-hydroxy acid dehydrogenase YdfG
LETTKALRSAGARIIIPAKRKDIAQIELKDVVPEEDIFEMDLADLNSVKKFTNSFHDLDINLDILINNAGNNGLAQKLESVTNGRASLRLTTLVIIF